MTDGPTPVSGFAAPDSPPAPRDLSDWLIAHGRHWATLTEVAQILDLPERQVPPAAARLREKGRLFSPTPGVYVPVPAEYRSWRAVPAAHFIDQLMGHLGHPYYVGLLSAAEINGAAHQRPQVFQVITPARLRNRVFGRVRLEFITSARTAERPTGTVNTPTGTMLVSTPEITVLDLVTWPGRGGGLSNVATVVGELVNEGRLDPDALAIGAATYPVAISQRCGWLIEHVGALVGTRLDLEPLARVAQARHEPTPLSASGRRAGTLDERWNVLVNVEVEPDL